MSSSTGRRVKQHRQYSPHPRLSPETVGRGLRAAGYRSSSSKGSIESTEYQNHESGHSSIHLNDTRSQAYLISEDRYHLSAVSKYMYGEARDRGATMQTVDNTIDYLLSQASYRRQARASFIERMRKDRHMAEAGATEEKR
jgi:hypothetical protein